MMSVKSMLLNTRELHPLNELMSLPYDYGDIAH